MTPLEFYTERAAECRLQAAATRLINVRDRNLASATAWDKLADRVRETDVFRSENNARLEEREAA
jgi:hypothetical protein